MRKQLQTIKSNSFKLLAFVLISILGIGSAYSQALTGTKNIPGDYATIAAAITDLNTNGVGGGGVTFNIAAGLNETLTSTLVVTATGTLANPIIFQKSGLGANPKITAYTGGTGTPTTTTPDGIWAFAGSDYITIDGIDLTDTSANTTVAATMEYGYGFFKVSGTDGAQNNTIRNCVITLNRLNNTAWTVGHFGSIGILFTNTTRTAATTGITVTNATGTNSNNKVYTNTIQNCNAGIVFQGFAALTPFTNGDTGNDIGGTSNLTGNSILNYGGASGAANAASGIFTINQWTLNVSYNNVDNNNGSGVNHPSTLRGINLGASTSANGTCEYNTVSLKGGGTTTAVEGILVAMGSTAASNTINIRFNTILNSTYTTATGGLFSGISSSSTAATVNITNNIVDGITYSNSSNTGTGVISGILNSGGTAVNIWDNVVKNISRVGTTGGTITGISITGGTTQSIRRDSVYNLSTNGGGTASTMTGIAGSATTITIDSCIVFGLSVLKSTGTGTITGIHDVSSPTNETYSNNRIFNLTHLGTGIVNGLNMNTTAGTRTAFKNIIYNLTATGGNINGINSSLSSPTISSNRIYNLRGNGATSGLVSGISLNSVSSGNANIIYNTIDSLLAPNISNTTDAIRGINLPITTLTSNVRVYYNTVRINASSSGANFSTAGVFHASSTTATTAALDMRNNIIINTSTPNGTGLTIAYRRSTIDTANYASTSNRNLFYAGFPASNRLVFTDGTNNISSLGAYKLRMVTRDQNSLNGNLSFQSLDPNNASYMQPVTTANLSESAGASIVGFTGDFTSPTARGGSYPLGGQANGGGQNVDLGAFELDMTPDLVPLELGITQTTGIVPTGTIRTGVLRVGVLVKGNGVAQSVSSLSFNTTGTTATSDLDSALLIYTGTNPNLITDSSLFGTPIVSPSGIMTFSGSRVLQDGINYFWLTYSIKPTAVSANFADAVFDSIVTNSVGYISANGNPSGNIQILNPLVYQSSTVTIEDTSRVFQGATNQQIARVMVVMNSLGAPVNITSMDVATTGTTSLTDITNLRVWSTGNSKVFATTTQFGTTVAVPAATQTTVGSTTLLADTNYFWVTYDIAGAAVANNVIDVEVTSITVAGAPQIPTVTAPVGSRRIRTSYCTTTYTNGCGTDFIARVRLKNLDNTSGCTGPLTYYSTLTIPNLTRGLTDTLILNYGSDANQFARAWIDYNDDGDFADPGEDLGQQTPANAGSNGQAIIVFTVPCNAPLGNVRIRIRGGDDSQPTSGQSCGASASTYGEAEDYLINILDNPLVVNFITAQQQTGVVAPNISDRQVLRMPYRVNGCGVAKLTEVRLTNTSTNATDIVNAKLYRTAGAVFNNSNLRATVAAPAGQFAFVINDTLVNNDTTNYWLAYDVAPGATLGNFIDASFDSASVDLSGVLSYALPVVGNPSGNIQIDAPMTFISSTATAGPTSRITRGTANNHMFGIEVVTSAIGSPINLTSIDLNLNGSTDTADIRNIKVWYTGNSSTFATTTQFGITQAFAPAVASPFGFTVTGLQALTNGTNYFWVTYDIKDTAVTLNIVDGECTSLTVGGVPQIPTVTSPVGSRQIIGAYCATGATNSGDTDIGQIQLFDATNAVIFSNGSATPTLNNPLATGTYSNFTGLTPVNLTRGLNYSIRMDQITQGATFYAAGLIVYIDYNNDGDFVDAGETVYTSGVNQTGPTGTAPTTTFLQGSFTIPCTAELGNLRMRVIVQEGISATPSCGTFAWGEAEDYTINVLDNPLAFNFTTAQQQPGVVAPGTSDRVITRIPVRLNGCGVAILSEVRMSTTGTTNNADIVNAKLYRTSGSTFNTSNLRATVAAPSGQFTFGITDTLTNNDTTNYWLAYDVAAGATLSNTLDATLDSIQVLGVYQIPSVTNPAGNIVIDAPMTYISSTTTQSLVSKAIKGTANTQILGIQVVTSAIGSPINLTSLDLNLNGTTDTADLQNIRVWYTGNSSTFATTTQFGTTQAFAPAVASPFGFTVTGTQALTNGTNYFWVTFDVRAGAITNNALDAECSSLIVAGSPQTPSVTAPAGNRLIKAPYCVPAPAGSPYITNITMGTMNYNPPTGTAVTTINPATATTSLVRGTTNTISITTDGNSDVRAWIDFDDNGVFDATEIINITTATTGAGIAASATFTVPCNAVLGELSMRVMIRATANPNTDPCRIGGSGAGQNYTITVLDNPIGFNFATAQQQVGAVAPNTLDRQVLRVPVRVNGCGLARIDEMRFTNTSTNAADIANAKLYRTTGNTFNTTNLRGTVASPVGQFTFTLTDTVALNDTMNYWLAYDIAPLATISNIADASFDSLQLNIGLGTLTYHVPTVSNPAGNVLIDAPMTYTSSTVTQANTAFVFRGDNNQEVIGFTVNMSAIGSPVNLTAIDLNLGGLTDTSDIQNIRVWYTGSSSTFATTSQFGTTQAFAPAVAAPYAFTVSGSQSMLNGPNYFWVTYDVRATATGLNVIDGEITQVTIAGNNHVPTVTAPTGNRVIRVPYCAASIANAIDTDIGQIQLFDATNAVIFSNGSATPTLNNPLATGTYSNFTGLTPVNLTRGLNYSIRMDQITSGATFYAAGVIVYIDYNDDGDFVDAGETVYTSGVDQTGPTGTAPTTTFLQGSFTIPCTAALGNLRMRVILQEGNSATPSCGTPAFSYGEVEDYTINVLDNPLAFNSVTAQQQTGVVAPGTTDRVITRIPIRVNGCGVAVLSEVRMSTTGTTNNADIVNAKLYRTTGSTFNTLDLRSTIASPSGQFTFAITDTLINNDTTNYWLAYDVASGATLGNVLDAALDSLFVLGSYRIPSTSNPAGNVYIDGITYTWNKTIPADYTIASNWTPGRTTLNPSDKLVFNIGGSIIVNNVINQTVSTITVSGSTNVQMNGSGTSLVVADSLNLASGSIEPSTLTLTVGTSASQPGRVTNGSGRIRGELTRWIGTTPNTYGFPIANSTRDRLAVINYTVAPGTSGTLTVGFNPANVLNNNGLPLTEGAINVNKHTPNGYWELTTGSGLTGGTYNITLNADSMIGITNVAGLVMLHRLNSLNPWTLQGTHVTTTGTATAPVLSRTGATVYGIWSMGADSAVNPLPVTLTQFTATPSGKDVQVTWTTASELNNSGFDVERSLDGRTFEKVTFVRGAGNSNKVLNYNFTDKGAFTKSTVWFYRLRQIDFDGKFAYSAIVRVNSAAENVKAVSVSPNPYTNNFNVSMVAAAEGNATIELLDMQGRLVSTRNVNVLAGANEVPVTDAATLRSGVYFVRVSMNGETQVVKLVKE